MLTTARAIATSALLLTAAGCATSSPDDRVADGAEAGRVAITYLQAVGRGDLEAASLLVAPEQRTLVQALALGDGRSPGEQRFTSDLELGRVEVTEATATATAVGELCRSASPDSPPTCIENTDVDTESPYFLVHLLHDPEDGWQVYFDMTASSQEISP